MDLFIVKERLKMMLWFVAAGFFVGLFATWHTWGEIGIAGEGKEQFLLSATVTGAAALAWVVLLVVYLSSRRVMDPRYNPPDQAANIPWWLIKCVVLAAFIAAMGMVLWIYSDRAGGEFTMLEHGHLDQLEKRIVGNPDRLDQKDKKSGKTLLELALESGDSAAVEMLLSNGAMIESVADRLNLVASLVNPSMLGVLLRHGVNPDTPDVDGMTPLHLAVESVNTNALILLIEGGANVNALDPIQQTPLMLAIMADNLPVAKTLLLHGANPNRSDQRGDTALHKAVRRRNLETTRFLLENGVDPSIFNLADMSPLHIAALNGQNELVELLVEQPGLVDLHNEKGRVPLEYALGRGQYDTARLLLRNGADINRVGKNGYTAVHLMLVARDYKTVEFLIGEGAAVDIANAEGETAADLMRSKGLQFLLDLVELRDHPPEPAAVTNAVDSVESL